MSILTLAQPKLPFNFFVAIPQSTPRDWTSRDHTVEQKHFSGVNPLSETIATIAAKLVEMTVGTVMLLL